MKIAILATIILVVLALSLVGCSTPQCYPPNNIVGNSCCIDDDSNGVCDLDESELAVEEETPAAEETETQLEETPVEEEPQIEKISPAMIDPAEIGLHTGKQMMKPGEKRDYLEINDLIVYRNSADRGVLDFMVFTVRNPSQKTITPVVEVLFQKARLEEHQANVKKEYYLDALKPGEKIVINQSMGVVFEKINDSKEIEMRVYDRYTTPSEDLGTLKTTFVPADEMASMEIYTYGTSEE